MKKIFLSSLIATVASLFVLTACSKGDDTIDIVDLVRQTAWNFLQEEKEKGIGSGTDTFITSKDEAFVERGIHYVCYYDRETHRLDWSEYHETDCFSIRYNTTDDALLGPLVLYVSLDGKTVIGGAPRF